MSQQQHPHHHHPYYHPRHQFQINNAAAGGQFGDTTYTKIFVGGLAWETQRDTMRRYFDQFGDILEAVVITDKNTGRSKGYGFVTFKDPESAMRACHDPSPVIDGRRANCNLASLGAQQNRPSPQQYGTARYRPVAAAAAASGFVAPPPPPQAYQGSPSAYYHQPGHYAYPYSPYGYTGYSQDNIYPMNYYNVYGGSQQYTTPYIATTGGATGSASGQPSPTGVFQNYVPYYPQSQQQGYAGIQYHPQVVQYPYLPQPYSAPGILQLPSPVAALSVATTTPSTGVAAGTGGSVSTSETATAAGSTTEHSPSHPSPAAA
ncbi:hypothetical protein ACHQM5_000021 [Ranunculus cassubicifolius]